MFWKKKEKFTLEEQELIDLIKALVENEDTTVLIDPSNNDYFIQNEPLKYSVIVNGVGVLLTNSVFSIRKSVREKVIDACKDFAKDRATKDRQKIREKIEEKENNMLTKMKENLL